MSKHVKTGLKLLSRAIRRLESITPDQYKPPGYKLSRNVRAIGWATDYQRALSTVLSKTYKKHVRAHEKRGMKFGGHINLGISHRALHTTEGILEVMLAEDLANTFQELSVEDGADPVDYEIGPDWRVYLVMEPIKRKPLKVRRSKL